ncbi:P-type DNA transfer ATPase VirB11 [Trinickia violacea]|uniref:Type IV secretion system protein n=1 Tax=Trinickia violacea TaxID=2571746 RepID=A0A4P8J2J7_9BURK|nr:P-type DNA transfer ATPase VirB11 [Trinickia violacea]QCP55126.1 P-type DNA transfer ATPase VirB11 [Trinickia violacea]
MSILPAFLNRTASLRDLFADDAVTEIAINGPGVAWAGRQGARFMERVELPDLTLKTLRDIAEQVAHVSDQSIDMARPLLAASIPSELTGQENRDFRVQIVLPPAVPPETISITMRKPSVLDLDMEYYEKSGAFRYVNEPLPDTEDVREQLARLYRDRNWPTFLRVAIRAKLNIIVSAATNTGKTEFIKMLLKLMNGDERIVTIEDAREIKLAQPNAVHLLYSRGNQGVSKVTPVDLMEASLRMSPDRIIPGELRGAEAYVALEMLNSGHDGFMTTLHAKSPNHMWDRLAQMVMRYGSTMGKAEIIEYARGLIDVVVQMHRYDDGLRGISRIDYVAH